MRFSVEEAKVRLYQGESAEAIRLLNGDWTRKLTDRDLAINRLIVLSLAEARMGEYEQAKQSIADAEAWCSRDSAASSPVLMRGEVLSAKGSLALEESNLLNAQDFFQQSLQIARANDDPYLEARALLNLGVVDLQQDHYEEALEQLQAASGVARAIGAYQILEKMQGNAGWAYYATGDYTRALTSFNAAAASAASLGSPIDEVQWLGTAGMSEARLGDLNAARERYNRSLALARSLKNAEEISEVDQALASLLLHSTHPETAEPYIREANDLAIQRESAFDVQLGNLLAAQLLVQRGNLSQAKTLLLQVER
jgi:tetratricopeptide (TPR) repeat protein